MGKPRMIGQFKPYLPNSKADMQRPKRWAKNREYTSRHEDLMGRKREDRQAREMEAFKFGG